MVSKTTAKLKDEGKDAPDGKDWLEAVAIDIFGSVLNPTAVEEIDLCIAPAVFGTITEEVYQQTTDLARKALKSGRVASYLLELTREMGIKKASQYVVKTFPLVDEGDAEEAIKYVNGFRGVDK